MTHRRIRWTERALRRLDEIGTHIEHDDPDAATRVVVSVDSFLEFPAAGRIGRTAGPREMVLSDIPYRVSLDIEILTVMHTSQK